MDLNLESDPYKLLWSKPIYEDFKHNTRIEKDHAFWPQQSIEGADISKAFMKT